MNFVDEPSSATPKGPPAREQDTAAEKEFITQYAALTGASETQARNVYMYSDIIQDRDPYGYRLE